MSEKRLVESPVATLGVWGCDPSGEERGVYQAQRGGDGRWFPRRVVRRERWW